MNRTPVAVIGSLLLALVVGFFGFGHYLYDAAIGLDPASFPLGGVFQSIGEAFLPPLGLSEAGIAFGLFLVLVAAVLGFFWVRSARRSRVAQTDPSRRSFLTGAASGGATALGAFAIGAGAGAARALLGVGSDVKGWKPISDAMFDRTTPYTHDDPKASWEGSRVSAYRRLGRTDWKVSDIVLGTGRIRGENGEKIARAALERGVNYFDTSPDYSGSGSEQAMGKAIAGVPRDQIFVATKFCTTEGHLPPGSSIEEYKGVVEGSLSRMGLEQVDLVHIHSCDEVDRLLDPNVHEAFRQLKEEGKARFLGFSTHTPRLEEVVRTGIESGKFDVMMVGYHHGIWPQLPALIERARKEQDMGVVAMKTLKGAKHRGLSEFQPYADSYSQAALKWALSNQDVSCAVISFFEPQHVNEFLYASGKPFTAQDQACLDEYDRQIAGTYCPPHCGVCHGSCPEGLPIADVLRHRMYFEDYKNEKEAMRLYAELDKNASVCASCSAPCASACPLGIAIPERMRGAHELLTLS